LTGPAGAGGGRLGRPGADMSAMLGVVRVLLRDDAFWLAAAAGLLAGVIAVAVRFHARAALGGALPAACATLAGLVLTDRASADLVVAVALLAGGGVLAGQRALPWRVAATVPGAALLGIAVPAVAPAWAGVAAGVATAALVPLACELDQRHPRLTAPLAAISALGVFGAVPDTEQARALVGATAAAAPFGVDPRTAPGPAGTSAVVGLLAWTAATGGWPRPGAVVGALACVGVLALGGLVAWARLPVAAVLLLHTALVVVASRGAGLRDRAVTAAAIVAAAYGAAVLGLSVWRAARRRARGSNGPADRSRPGHRRGRPGAWPPPRDGRG